MNKLMVVWLLVMGLAGFTGCERQGAKTAARQKDIVAKVGDEIITLDDVNVRISKLPAQYQNMVKNRKKELVEDMVLEQLFYDEALRRGIQNNKEVKELLKEAQKRIIISKFITDEVEVKAAVSDKEAENYYNTHKEEFVTPERWKASHILVKTEEEAKLVLDELSKGRAFEDLAKEKSQDASAKNGGDLGFFTKGQMVPEFEEAVMKLEVGQTSGVVKSQFGYHVVTLTDKKPVQVQGLQDVSARIKNELMMNKKRGAFDKLAGDLKAKAKVTINESLLMPEEDKAAPKPVAPDESGAEKPGPTSKNFGHDIEKLESQT